jgi:hypothetical protein
VLCYQVSLLVGERLLHKFLFRIVRIDYESALATWVTHLLALDPIRAWGHVVLGVSCKIVVHCPNNRFRFVIVCILDFAMRFLRFRLTPSFTLPTRFYEKPEHTHCGPNLAPNLTLLLVIIMIVIMRSFTG